jgi:hypothetical protein
MDDRRRYRAYLVRFWDAGDSAVPRWRAPVQDAQTGERRGFPDRARRWALLVAELGTSTWNGAASSAPGDDHDGGA